MIAEWKTILLSAGALLERHPFWVGVPLLMLAAAAALQMMWWRRGRSWSNGWWSGGRAAPRHPKDSELHLLTVLIEAARADTEFRGEVLALFDLPAARRRQVLTDSIARIRSDKGTKGRPQEGAEELAQAFALLRDDEVVTRARVLLEEA